ncbi:MAG: response regulator [Bryobacteraceae bacterium]
MSKPKILVIDDNPSDVQLLQIALSEQNCEYEIEIATDGELAIRVVLEQCEKARTPCIIVLDMHLPKYDGVEVLQVIRRQPELRHVKVIITTTTLSPKYRADVLDLGGHYYPKPGGLGEFEDLARFVLGVCRTFEGDFSTAALHPA